VKWSFSIRVPAVGISRNRNPIIPTFGMRTPRGAAATKK
jgi:hypothetical protein